MPLQSIGMEHPLFPTRKPEHPAEVPFMVFADENGDIIDHDVLRCVGRSGLDIVALKPEDFIPLPEGSEYFLMPSRAPYGYNPETDKIELFEGFEAVAAFISPAHTQTYLSAYAKVGTAPILPLYAYTAIGWYDDKFWTTAVRIDSDIRQDVSQFHMPIVNRSIDDMRKKYPENRLVEHLATNCASEYHCRAAQNFFLNRWECPIPASPACNATCLGCISLQEDEEVSSAHFRLKFTPKVNEVAEIALDHITSAPYPVISFGQGCEGEPLLVWEVIRDSILEIRKHTDKGIININTNGSRPDAVEKLCEVGLQSIRVSLNSTQKEWYDPYYLPRNYKFEALAESIKTIRKHNGWASINYFVFPGLTDTVEEYESLRKFIRDTDLTMIQWRNFNIDPDWYFKKTRITNPSKGMGVKKMMELIREEFPGVAYGYFNPAGDAQEVYNEKRIAFQG